MARSQNKAYEFDYKYIRIEPRINEPSVTVKLTTAGRVVDRVNEGDCTIRAMATFLDLPYQEVKELAVEKYGYRKRGGMSLFHFMQLAKDFGLMYVTKGVRLNSKTAKSKLPTKAILLFREHVAAYEEGTIFDVFVTTNVAGCKQTKGYWTLPEYM